MIEVAENITWQAGFTIWSRLWPWSGTKRWKLTKSPLTQALALFEVVSPHGNSGEVNPT
jgi:hypothetical protein